MAEIITSTSKKGRISHKVIIFLGRVGGKRKYKYKTFHGKRSDAEKWAREQEHLRDTGKLPPDEKVTLLEWLDKYFQKIETVIRAGTLSSYRELVRYYIEPDPIADLPLVRIKTFHVQNLYDSLVAKRLSARTIEAIHTVINPALEQAVGFELITRNPARYAVRPKKKKPKINCFSSEQAEQFLDAARQDKLHVWFVLALTLGLRPEETSALQWSDIDFDRQILRINRVLKFHKNEYARDESGRDIKDEKGKRIKIAAAGYYFDDPKTDSSARILQLNNQHIKLLKTQKNSVLESRMASRKWEDLNLVFPSECGTPHRLKNIVDRHYSKILKAAGLPHFNIYSLRHSYATLSLMGGIDIGTVSANLGHTKASFTMDTYTHVLDEMRERARDKSEGIFFKKQMGENNLG
jgi:integrase